MPSSDIPPEFVEFLRTELLPSFVGLDESEPEGSELDESEPEGSELDESDPAMPVSLEALFSTGAVVLNPGQTITMNPARVSSGTMRRMTLNEPSKEEVEAMHQRMIAERAALLEADQRTVTCRFSVAAHRRVEEGTSTLSEQWPFDRGTAMVGCTSVDIIGRGSLYGQCEMIGRQSVCRSYEESPAKVLRSVQVTDGNTVTCLTLAATRLGNNVPGFIITGAVNDKDGSVLRSFIAPEDGPAQELESIATAIFDTMVAKRSGTVTPTPVPAVPGWLATLVS